MVGNRLRLRENGRLREEELVQNGNLMEGVHFVKGAIENVLFMSRYGWILCQLFLVIISCCRPQQVA
jgi:hypothetical protein